MPSRFSGLTFGVLAPKPAKTRLSAHKGSRRPGIRARAPRVHHFLGLAISLLLAASMWFYTQGILIPYQRAEAARYGRPRGNLSDLYPRWLGARELLLHGQDPYSRQVTRQIQVGYFGRELDPRRPNDPKDQNAFAYPVYVVFLLAPLVNLDFSLVRSVFTWVLAALILASVLLWLKALGWQVSRTSKLILLLLTIGSYPAVQAIKLQQLTIVVSALIAAAAASLAAGWLALAGLLLAFSTIKPQLVAPVLIVLILWVAGGWSKRWPALASFMAAMACLVIGGELVLPGWIVKFVSALSAYRQYTGGISILQELLSPAGGAITAAVLLILLALLAWKCRREPAGSEPFGLMLSLSLAITLLVIPTWSPYNQILLLPAVLLLLRKWRALSRLGPLPRLLYLTVAGLILWPWCATVYLSGLCFLQSCAAAEHAVALPVASLLLIPFGITALLGMYAVRRRGALST